MKISLQRAVSAALLLAGLSMSGSALAYDASLPYRNAPGFQCFRWNTLGECTEWSSYDQYTAPSAAPSYYPAAPAYPTYPAYPSYPTYPTTYPTSSWRCNPRIDCTGSVSIRVSATPNPVRAGSTLTYNLYVRNDDSQARTVNVRAYLDSYTSFQTANFNGERQGNVITWNNQLLSARSSRTFIVHALVQGSSSIGRSLVLRGEADGHTDSTTIPVTYSDSYSYGYRTPVRFEENVYVRPTHYTERYSSRTYPASSYYTQSSFYSYPTINYSSPYYSSPTYYNGGYSSPDYYSPVYYYDSNGRLHYRGDGGNNGGATYYCDSSRFVCSY